MLTCNRHRCWLPVHDDVTREALPALVHPGARLRPAAHVHHAQSTGAFAGRLQPAVEPGPVRPHPAAAPARARAHQLSQRHEGSRPIHQGKHAQMSHSGLTVKLAAVSYSR